MSNVTGMTREEQAAANRAHIERVEPELAAMIAAIREVQPRAKVAYIRVEGMELGDKKAYAEEGELLSSRSASSSAAIDKRSLREREAAHISEALRARDEAVGGAYRGKGATLGRRA